MLEIVPDALIGIQVGRIAGQARQPNAGGRTIGQELLDGLAAMDGCTIPDNQQLAADLLQQPLEKGDDAIAIEGGIPDGQIQLTCWCNGADHREMIAREFTAQHRRFTRRRPGCHHAGQQVERRFIDIEEGALLILGFF